MTPSEQIALVLRDYIKEKRTMSQVELAKRMSVTPAAVTKWLKDGSVSIDKIPLLCESLGITPNTLFGFPDSKISSEALRLYSAFLKHPEYQESVTKLLNIILDDIETTDDSRS